MYNVSTRPSLDHVPLPLCTCSSEDSVLSIEGALPTDCGCFVTESEEDGMMVKIVFPAHRAAGAKWVVRAAREGMINNEKDAGRAMRIDELIHVRRVVAYSMRVQNNHGNRLWQKTCREIKISRGGRYPRDWGPGVLMFYDDKVLPHVEAADIEKEESDVGALNKDNDTHSTLVQREDDTGIFLQS